MGGTVIGISDAQQRALEAIAPTLEEGTYLAGGVAIATAYGHRPEEDLACMKASAIAGRGAAKDFWDLDVLLEDGITGGDLEGLLAAFARKYPVEDVGHVVRSLAYFADADAAPLPTGLTPERWEEIKSAFERRVRRL